MAKFSDANANTKWGTIDADFRSIITITFGCMPSGLINLSKKLLWKILSIFTCGLLNTLKILKT